MFFNDLIERKLTSLLRPWLRVEESELEVKLGFLRSDGVLRNLRFNTTALNELLDDPSSLRFKDVTVEQLTIRVSNWLSPSFTFQVHGLHVTLSAGEKEADEGGMRRRRKVKDTSGEDMEKLLSELDPEGSALHDAIKRISNLSGRSWKTSIYSTILGRCRLKICGINVLIESPCSNEMSLLSLEIKEIGVQPQSSLRGSRGESYFDLDVKGLEVDLRSKSTVSSIVPSTDLFTSLTLKNLQLTDIIFSVPSLNFSFSPTDFSIILLFFVLSSRESNYARSGRQLWRTAASRISSLIPIPKLSWYRVVHDVCLWLQYLHSYENMLLLIGYPMVDSMKRSATMVVKDRTYSRSLTDQLKVISDIEKHLPAEAIAQARRIARYRAAPRDHRAMDICDDSKVNSIFWKIYQILALIWNVTCGVFYSLKRVLFLRKVVSSHPKTNEQLEANPGDPLQPCCIALKVEEFSISVFPQTGIRPPIRGKLVSEVGLSYEDLLSFRLSVDAFFFSYLQNSSKQCLTFAFGCFKVVSSSAQFHHTQAVLWSEPAQFFCSDETIGVNPASKTEEASFPHGEIGCRVGKVWSNWRNIYQSCDKYTMQSLENPSIICESKSFLIDQSLKDWTCGFWDCSLVVGKFNLLLEYSSIISIAILSRQMQLALCETSSSKRLNNIMHSPTTLEDLPVIDWKSKYTSYSRRFEMEMYRLLPHKHIQIAALIAGPHIQISLKKENFHGIDTALYHIIQKDEVQMSFAVHDVELVASPNLGLVSESCRLKVPQEIDSPESDSKKNIFQGNISLGAYLKINGLTAYVGESEIPDYQILMLSPTTVELSSLRKNVHSFGSTAVAFSAALQWETSAFATTLFLDELFVLVKVISGLFDVLECAFTLFNSVGGMSSQEELGQLMLSEETFLNKMKQTPVVTDILCVARTSFELKSMHMVLSDSRRSYDVESHMTGIDAVMPNKLGLRNMSGCGIHIFVQQLTLELSLEDEKADVLFDLTEFGSVLFKYSTDVSEIFDQIKLENLQSLNCLSEASCSHCKLSLCLGNLQKAWHSANVSNTNDASTSSPVLDVHESSPLVMDAERSEIQSSNCLSALLSLNEVYIVGGPVKKFLAKEHKSNFLEASLSVAGLFQAISCQSEGGSIFLETTALVMFVKCFTSHFDWMKDLSAAVPSSEERVVRHGEDMASMDNNLSPHVSQPCQINLDLLEAFAMDISQLSLALVASDDSGKVEELIFSIDTHLDLRVLNMARKASFVISKLSVLSLSLGGYIGEQNLKVQSPQLSSAMSVNSSISLNEDPSVALEHGDRMAREDVSSSRLSVSENEHYANDPGESNNDHTGLHIFSSKPHNCILKESTASLTVECPMRRDRNDPLCPNVAWVGNGSLSGLEFTISLRELQMILFAVESMSELFSKETSNDVILRNFSSSQESEVCPEESVPDGTLVAIQDVYQHMYIIVEGAESKYNLGGAVHYSLVGERALFRVKYHKARWKSQIQYFSLLSVFAKSDSGEPLRLNCRSGSDFLDISGSDDSAWSLWRVSPYKVESYEDDIEWDSYRPLGKNTFSLVNRKNDRAVAFIDGIWEFTSKPGNPFKMKVLHDPSPSSNIVTLDRYLLAGSGTTLENDSQTNDKRELDITGKLSGIVVTLGKVNLTIVHELSYSTERFPLLQGSINSTDVIVQIFSNKVRVMSTPGILLHYFDAQRNIWRELVDRLEICIFYRSRFLVQGSENVSNGVPVHLYARIDELNVLLSELSLDILLFVIGKLNLGGPYAIKSSTILANCCEVENHSGLSLLCQFNNDQNVSIAGRQSGTIFLRHLASRNQRPEPSFFSVQLARGPLLTSLVHRSLVEAEAVAWRTRIVSSQESKTFPGPFLVIEVSRTNEDGLSITISPLLRIYNETDFSMELRFQRPQQKETEFAYLMMLNAGDIFDDAMAAFGATNLSGGSKKASISLGVGNFLFSFRPNCRDVLEFGKISSVEWSEDLKGGKPVRLSGIFDKLTYQVRKAFSMKAVKSSLSTAHCVLKSEDGRVANIHFLIQSTTREIPVIQKDSSGQAPTSSPVALQEQKEIFLLPTVHVSNFLHTEIFVNLTDRDPQASAGYENIGSQATIPGGSTANLYANPSTIYFVVTLTSFDSSCKPVNSSDLVKKLEKEKNTARHLDIELDFGGGKYFAFLRLSRGHRGMLEAAIFTSYTLANDTDYSLFCFAANQKPLSRGEVEKLGSESNLESGSYFPPKSIRSWLMKSPKVQLKILEEKAPGALLDLDALTGLTEIDLDIEDRPGCRTITKLGVSLRPPTSELVQSQIVSMKPRFVVLNESEQIINVRQCYFEGDTEGIMAINSKQRATLKLQSTGVRKIRETTVFENFLKKHTKAEDDSLLLIQFRPDETGLGWSGPVCITSLGRFFLKFRSPVESYASGSDSMKLHDPKLCEFASVHVAEEGSTIVLHFHKPPKANLPYRIENCLRKSPITYYQKDFFEPEILGSGASVDYVWDNLTLPRKLVVQIDDVHLLREINLDKLRGWKPFYKVNQNRGLGFQLPLSKKPEDQKQHFGRLASTETVKLGYEVYADGLTRVLRISDFSDRRKEDIVIPSSSKMRLKISNFTIQLLERARQEINMSEQSTYTPLISTRLRNMNFDSMSTGLQKFNKIRVQSLSVDQKWVGAPFAAMLRRHQLDSYDANDYILQVALVLLPSRSGVKQVKYLSIVLQPLDLNIDEETLMRIIPFSRTSLSDSPSQQYYFDHFEIHPIKIVASFLPEDSYTGYSSTQEAMRSLLHSVIKIPAVKNTKVELNGVLVTHALITLRELSIRCAQHYSWYSLRAIYIAKGSTLLPPVFASIFDDLSSSSLDIFFDPSSGLINLPGLTIGTFKLISKCINGKGFSGTKRYFGDLGKTLKSAGSNVLFAAVTEVSDSILKGAETNGWNGLVTGFHQGILKLAMEPSVLGSAFLEGGPDRKIKLDRSPGVDELYIEGYLQAMLDTMYMQEYLRVRVLDNQVVLKNLPPNSSLVEEIMERVKRFLVSKALLKGDSSTTSHSLRHIRGESEWKFGPIVLTLCEHLFVSFAIRFLRKRAGKVMAKVRWNEKSDNDDTQAVVPKSGVEQKVKLAWKWGIGKFVLSGMVAYIDGRLCRAIPNPLARRIVSGFLLSFLDNDDDR